MEVFWLTPAAWWGLATIAVPIVIHLLTRQQTRLVPFPTLRFLHTTRLPALRRRSIHDWPLLLVRAAILAAAVAALAGPVFVSAARKAQWQTRVVRALVVAPAQSGSPEVASILSEEARASFESAVFQPATNIADGLREAADWLTRRPPAAREVVIVGDLKEGALGEPDLTLLPPTTGVRFVPLPDTGDPAATIDFPSASVTLTADRTTAVHRSTGLPPGSAGFLSVRAAPDNLAMAEAARDAVLARGVRVDRAGRRRVLVIFEGGDTKDVPLKQPADAAWMRDALARLQGMTGGQHDETMVVLVGQPARGVETAHVIDRIARAAFAEDLRMFEPRRIPAATLAAWSRPPQPAAEAPLSDERDRRWLWALALALLALESVLRRATRTATSEDVPAGEQRVA